MLQNKYTRIYYQIIDRAVPRTLVGYKEKHHIIPQSLGGSNDNSNLVHLTAREHFICHWLLTKMTESDDRAKMVYALRMMSVTNDQQQRYTTQITARVYETYRKEHATNHSRIMKGKKAWNKGIPQTDDHKKKNREAALKRPPRTAESIAKGLAKTIGRKRSEEFKLAHSIRFTGVIKGPQSEEHKLAISLSSKGIKKIKSHGENVAKANIGNISINKDGVEKKVKQPDLQVWLDQGWLMGGKKRKA